VNASDLRTIQRVLFVLTALSVFASCLYWARYEAAHAPCSHYANTAVRYVPLRCLNDR
jgi:hypothetical protein